MRIIDAKNLEKQVKEAFEKTNPVLMGCLLRWIRYQPTIDAVPVVRCRECNHCDPENYHCDHPMSTAAPLRRKPDDFCSYGKRKEGADNG